MTTSEDQYGQRFAKAAGAEGEAVLGRLFALTQVITPFAVRAAIALGVADRLAAGPMSLGELAGRTGADPDSLGRLMRLLVARGVFGEPEPRVYELTDLSRPLCGDHPSGIRFFLDPQGPMGRVDAACAFLLDAVRTGKPVYERMHGLPFWDDLAANPALAAAFDFAMAAQLAGVAKAVSQTVDWTALTHVVDVGGGRGTQLAAILQDNPHLRGTVVDGPGTAVRAREHLAECGLAGRGEVVVGDFFDPLPAGADVYLLCRILHSWDDERAVAILRRCAEAAGERGLVVLVEDVPDTSDPFALPSMDLRMLVALGGKERTVEELRPLVERAGLRLDRAVNTGLRLVVECRPAA